jgi:hypothetical protein
VCYLDCWVTRFSRPPPLAWLGADADDRAPGSCGRACTGYPAPASLQCQHRAELRIGPLVPDPFINNCNYDAAGEVLQWIYGTLRRRKTGRLQGSLIEFDQNEFLPNPASHGLANTGWLFLPMDCANGQACRLHIVFHGRKQYQTYLYFSSGAALRAHLLQRQDDCSLLRSCRNTGRRMLFKSRSTAPQREA